MTRTTMNKLSALDRQKVTDALAECARQTKDIEDPKKLADAAYDILSKRLGNNPGLYKAACQVYNSCKSIHKLSSADDAHRGDSFSILDVQQMVGRLSDAKRDSIRKAASIPSKFTYTGKPQGNLTKAASSHEAVVEKKPALPNFSIAEYKRFMRDDLDDIEDMLTKSAAAVKVAEAEKNSAYDKFISAMATEISSVRKEAAARLYSNFKDEAVKLIDKFNSVRPMSKVASDYVNKYRGTASLPNSVTIACAKAAIEADRNLEKKASNFETIIKRAVRDIEAIAYGYGAYLQKKASVGAGVAAGTGLTTASLINAAIGLDAQAEEEKIKRDIYNAEYVNNLLAHSYQRAFIRAATNKAIKTYSLDKIVPAFNRAVAKLPQNTRLVPATANQQLIESMMIDELAKGSVPSKADVDIITNLANTVGKLKTDTGIYEGNAPEVNKSRA